ncbi:MAG TPA: AfsR/SARP family transcriptional regulator [Kineosporiaceae bacterium]
MTPSTPATAHQSTSARFQIIGPISVTTSGGYPTLLTGRKVGAVLVTLAVRANLVTPLDTLVAEVWGDRPPRRTVASVQVYISQLRRLMGQRTATTGPLITTAPGYLLRVGPGDLDSEIFRDLLEAGRAQLAAGLLSEAGETLQRALDMAGNGPWTQIGHGPLLREFASWLERSRIECLDLLVQVAFARGRHAEQISHLYALVSEHPLHESFAWYLMESLRRSNRRAEALRVFDTYRTRLAREFGLEPGPDLTWLRNWILESGTPVPDLPHEQSLLRLGGLPSADKSGSAGERSWVDR